MAKKSAKKIMSGGSKPQPKKMNLFELHINRKKYDVLGVKSKSERGLPGVSRARSLRKRKGTLLQEYKMKDKKNIFYDRRIGERNSAMTAEDKILARYTAERMKFHSKKSIYNLGDDEELTHRGQTLTEIEKFDDPKSDDDEDEEENGTLNSNFVEDIHFGGGMFKKVDEEPKSRKDLIDKLISESIKRKAEKQKMRQETFDMTEKLDSDWKELLPLVTVTKKTKSDPEPDNKKVDVFANYDVLSKKLRFEARGKPSDRLKSEEELAKEEKEKLESLERERIERMLGNSISTTIKHRSADDMDDGFALDIESQVPLTYKDGMLNNRNQTEIEKEELNQLQKDENVSEVDEDHNSSDDQNGDDGDGEGDGDDDDEEEEEEEDDYSDLKESDSSDTEMVQDSQNTEQENPKIKVNEIERRKDICLNSKGCAESEDKEADKARKELPFTFQIPKQYEEFEKLMNSYNPHYQAVIIERMIKCHHPSLNEQNKEDLDFLFTFLLQHIQDCTYDDLSKRSCFTTLDKLAPWFFDLVQWNPLNCSVALMEVINEKYNDYLKNKRKYPLVDTLIFLKIVSLLFPTSDFRHPVVTPSLVFMQEILFNCKIQSSIDVSSGLYLTTLLLEYCSLSKRIAPEALMFLQCVLRLAHPKDSSLPINLPLQIKSFESCNLNISEKSKNLECTKLSIDNLLHDNLSDEFKVNSLGLALNLLSRFCDFYNESQYAILLFGPFIPLLDSKIFGNGLKSLVDEVLKKIFKMKDERLKMLVLAKKKPKPLRLYEPNIEQVYNLKKHQPMGKKKAERAKLMHKYKREMKGALREIRRDRSFLCKLKYKEIVQSDLERKRKVQEILSSAAEQQGELRGIERRKK